MTLADTARLAALGACCAYGLTGVLVKRYRGGASPRGMAAGNQLAAALAGGVLILAGTVLVTRR